MRSRECRPGHPVLAGQGVGHLGDPPAQVGVLALDAALAVRQVLGQGLLGGLQAGAQIVALGRQSGGILSLGPVGVAALSNRQKAVEQVAGEASATMTANLDASNERAERMMAATAKLEARQLWAAAAAMCLALLPVVVVVAGLWMGIAGLITGAQWALDVDGRIWLGIGRWLVVSVGLAGAGYGLFASVRSAAGLVKTWKGRGVPKWPRWR